MAIKTPYMIKEIIDEAKVIIKMASNLKPPKPLTEEELSEGLRVSHQGASTPEDVAMTPLMSEVLKRTGEKKDNDWRLKAGSSPTRAEEYINKIEEALLREFNGPEQTEFNESLPIDDIKHYDVQCWRNRKIDKRDIAGQEQEKERQEVADQYTRATEAMDVIKMLEQDIIFQKAVQLVMDAIPSVKANNDYKLVSQPFMNKDSNVTYPWFRNDRAIDPGTGKTYGEMAVDLAKTVPIDKLYLYNYTTLFGRNQKKKGRAIYATSRIVNIVLNQLEAEEIKAYKAKSPLFLGYGNDEDLKNGLIRMRNECYDLSLKCRNVDQNKFDLHVREAFIVLVGAMSTVKANGSKSKMLARMRAVLATQSWLINGLTGSVPKIFGRIFSGYIDTNRMGGLINAIAVLYAVMKQNPKYSSYTYRMMFWMLVMGDDNLFVYDTLDYERFKEDLKKIGFDVNAEKDEYGLFFLQYRLFKYNDDFVMAYAWTRVLRALLFKETAKGLGPYGWTLAFWQQISKCVEYKPALTILVNIVAELDDLKLCLDMPINELMAKIRAEDSKAQAELNTPGARARFTSTEEKLYDGDPQKERFMEASYLEKLQKAMREVYDPNFFNKHHLPRLPKVN